MPKATGLKGKNPLFTASVCCNSAHPDKIDMTQSHNERREAAIFVGRMANTVASNSDQHSSITSLVSYKETNEPNETFSGNIE